MGRRVELHGNATRKGVKCSLSLCPIHSRPAGDYFRVISPCTPFASRRVLLRLLALLATGCSWDHVLGYGPENPDDPSHLSEPADGAVDVTTIDTADATLNRADSESSLVDPGSLDADAGAPYADVASDSSDAGGATDAFASSDGGDATSLVDGSTTSDASVAVDAATDAASDVSSGGPILSEACSADGWCWTNPLPQGNALRGAWGFSANDIWAVGDSGAIVHFVGTGWSGATSGTVSDLHAVWGSTPSNVWAVGANGTIVHWDGMSWSPSPAPTTTRLQSVSGTGPSDAWAVGTAIYCLASSCSTDDGAILHWNGSTWSSITTGIDSSLFLLPSAVLANAPDDVWVGGQRGLLHWNGTAWAVDAASFASVVQLRGTGKNDVWAVEKLEQITDSTVKVHHWDGNAWTTTTPPIRAYKTPLDDLGAGGTGPNDFWVSHGDLTHWDGNAWSSIISGASHAIWLSAPGDGWAVGDIGQARHLSGTAWSTPPSSLNYGLNGVWGAAPDDVWAVGSKFDISVPSGRILHWNGAAWSEALTLPSSSLSAVWGSGAKDVWAVGDQAIQHWDGSSWQSSPSPSGAISVWGSGPNDVFAVASDRKTILHWNGGAWSPSLNDPNTSVSIVAGSGPQDVWAAGSALIPFTGTDQPSLFHFDGNTWTRSTLGTYWVSGLWAPSPNSAWAGTQEGVIFHWDGEAWSPWGDPVGQSVTTIWGGPFGEIWAATPEPTRGIMRSEVVRSNGTSWIRSTTGTAPPVSAGLTLGNTTWIVGGDGMALRRAIPAIPADAGADAAIVDGGADGGAESGGPQVAQISMSGYGQCSLLTDGTVTCVSVGTPPSGVFTEVSVGGQNGLPPFACGVQVGGALSCWGFNVHGEATPPSGTFTHVSTGGQHACAIRDDKTLACWGTNTAGQATPPAGSFVEVSAGDAFSCAIKDDASLTCWGRNSAAVLSPPTGSFLKVSASTSHACALRTDKTVACWGDLSYGETDAPPGPFLQVDTGFESTCGLRPNGGVVCWGRWHDATLMSAPTGTFRQISQGSSGGCGVLVNGTVSCWSGYFSPGG